MMQEKYFDSHSEYERAIDRFAAFSRVFTRNYLYRIELLIAEIQTSTMTNRSFYSNKISLLYDILHMALAYYVRHVKNFPKHIAFDKTLRLLYFVHETVRICVERRFFDDDDFIIQVCGIYGELGIFVLSVYNNNDKILFWYFLDHPNGCQIFINLDVVVENRLYLQSTEGPKRISNHCQANPNKTEKTSE